MPNHALSAAEGERPIRVLIAKPGLDGHDRGAKGVPLTPTLRVTPLPRGEGTKG